MEDVECSSSDSDDEEYIPEGEGPSSGSEVSEGELEDTPVVSSEGRVKKKRQLRRKQKSRPVASTRKRKGGLRIKGTKDTVEDTDSVDDDGGDLRDKDEGCEEEKSHEMEDKKEKERIDSLWAMFKSDTGLKSKNSGPSKAATCTESERTLKDVPKKVKIKKSYDFAGEEVVVEKEVAADSKEAKKFLEEKSNNDTSLEPAAEHAPRSSESESRSFNPTITTATVAPTSPVAPKIATIGSKRSSGLSTVLQSLNKKPKMSTLEKSHLDWQKFKTTEGLEEELLQHNKDGYLAKQAFLQETDVRQFELERDERLKRFRKLH